MTKENGEKPFDQLRFSDDFMFRKVLERNKDICRKIIEMVMHKKVKNLTIIQDEKGMEAGSDIHGVRLDVYMEDEDTMYDVEMQTTWRSNIPKRARYYQDMLDINSFGRSIDYGRLKNNVIIFICLDNPFKLGLHKYVFTNLCVANPELEFGDGTLKIILTPDSEKEDDVSKEELSFLNFIAGKEPQDDFTNQIAKEVAGVRQNDMLKREYMSIYARDWDKFSDGKAEGRAEVLLLLIEQGYGDDAVLKLGFTQEEIDEARKELPQKAEKC